MSVTYVISGRSAKGGAAKQMAILSAAIRVDDAVPNSTSKTDLEVVIEGPDGDTQPKINIMGGERGNFHIGFTPNSPGQYWLDFIFKGALANEPFLLPVKDATNKVPPHPEYTGRLVHRGGSSGGNDEERLLREEEERIRREEEEDRLLREEEERLVREEEEQLRKEEEERQRKEEEERERREHEERERKRKEEEEERERHRKEEEERKRREEEERLRKEEEEKLSKESQNDDDKLQKEIQDKAKKEADEKERKAALLLEVIIMMMRKENAVRKKKD